MTAKTNKGRLNLLLQWEFAFSEDLTVDEIDANLTEIGEIVALAAHRAVNLWGDEHGIDVRRVGGNTKSEVKKNGQVVRTNGDQP